MRNTKVKQRPGGEPTPLGYCILGLVGIEPQSGYEIGKIFKETPMEAYSSSPGAIYPAIERLKALKLVAHDAATPGRGRGRLAITKRGRAALVDWLTAPISTDDVKHRLDQLLLRFAYMEHFVPRAHLVRFLLAFNKAMEAYVGELKRYYARSKATMTPVGRLALENGVEAFSAHQRWGKRALAAIASGKASVKERGKP
jgi:DNA-binding PadR family transcriptional regulator